MAAIAAACPQLGLVRFEENAIRPSNYTHGLRISYRFQRSVFDVTRKPRRIRKIAVVRARTGGVIEKEQQFKPSFEEYLKAMETVKIRREKRKASSGTSPSPSRRSGEETVELCDSQEQIIEQKVVSLNQDEVKKKWTRKQLDSKEAQIVVRVKDTNNNGVGKTEEKHVKSEGQSFNMKRGSEISSVTSESYVMGAAVNKVRVVYVKKPTGSGTSDPMFKNDNYDSMKIERAAFKSVEELQDVSDQQRVLQNLKQDVFMKKWTRNKLDSKETKIDEGFIAIDTSGIGKTGNQNVQFQGQSFNMKRGSEISSVKSESYVMDAAVNKERVAHVKKLTGKSDRMVKHDNYDSMGIERAAFKSLEEFHDVCSQPRVSRADMEERIQRLAKCLNGASIDTPEWNFSKIMRSAKIRFADFSMIRLIQILGNYGNWRRVLQVIEWIQSRERFKSNRIRHIYTAALDALGKARRPVEALNVFHTMQQHTSSYPDLVAYHCIAVTLGQAGHMRELFHVIDSMRSPPKKKLPTGVLQKWDPRLEPDIIVYNAVLNACVRQKNLEGAFWALQELKQQHVRPNSITYGLVMEVMLACEKYNLVHEFFKKMQKSFIPNSVTYKVLVNTLWREGKVDEATRVVKDMERRGVVGSAGLYYDLARCLCSAGRCEEALMQIEKICKVANKPLVVTYTGLIQACLDSGDIQSGIFMFDHMRKFCAPNLVTYNIMLKGCLDHHKFDEARDLFDKLLENGNHVACKADYKHVVLPDVHTFNLMLDACLVNKRWDDLECIYTTMLQHGYFFNAKRHSRMILEACKAGKVNLLETTWKHLVEGDRVPPPSVVQQIFCLKLEQDDYAAAFSCVVCLPSTESHKYSRSSWLHLFRDNPRLFREEALLQLTEKLHAFLLRNEEPNTILLSLMKSCKEILRIQ